jgi:GMC oxidoreductase
MSDDPKQGVVDSDDRVLGMSNLFVAGSSVFRRPAGLRRLSCSLRSRSGSPITSKA